MPTWYVTKMGEINWGWEASRDSKGIGIWQQEELEGVNVADNKPLQGNNHHKRVENKLNNEPQYINIIIHTKADATKVHIFIYGTHPFTVVHRREKKCQAWPLNIFFYTWIKLSNEPKNKIFQRGIFEKIRFEAFSLLKDGRKLEQNH